MFIFVMIIFLSAKTSITIKGLTDVSYFNEKQTKCNRNNIHEKHKMKNINMPFFTNFRFLVSVYHKCISYSL